MIKKLNALKNQKGMTLVELLAVMVIIGIIAAISIPAIGNLIENSRRDAHVANVKALQEAARLYVNSNEATVSKLFSQDSTSVTLTMNSATNWTTTVQPSTTGVVATDFDEFELYMDSLIDPHTKSKYNSATIVITEEDGKYVYTISMVGPKANINTDDALNFERGNIS